ncbi:TolC family protein [Brevundimonas sp.]|uniref:TolC family protein n=1 Tax=Brevundimonas sp. TaxID=1871086 RepID=UPI0028A1B8F0|nr:TolC family protein [Brevundimonas sp.]
MTFEQARARLESTSSLTRAADYGVQAAQAHANVAAGLHRPTVSLDAMLIRYRKTFDLDLSEGLDRAQQDIGAAIPGLVSNLPGVTPDLASLVEQRLQQALPEIFAALPSDLRLRLEETSFRPTVTAIQPIYSGGAIPALQRAAQANVALAEARRAEAGELESVNLVRAYFGQVLAAEALKVAIDTRDGFDLHLRNARRMEAEGVLAHAQVLQVEVARDTAQRQVNRAEVEYENADVPVTPSSPLFVNRESAGAIHAFTDPSSPPTARVAQAEAGRNLAEAGADLAASQFKPKVYAFGTYNMNPDDALATEPDWAFGVGMRYTLMSSVNRREMVGAARAQASAASALERQARDDSRLLITRAYNQTDLARRQFLSLQSSLNAAEENLRVQEIAFREGETTASVVIEARNMLSTAKLQRALTAYEYTLSLAALLAASGQSDAFADYLQRPDRIVAQ